MAQINDSQPAHPVITFRVNLETVDRQGHLVPNRIEASGNETVAEADQMKNNRTIYLPGLLVGENKHKLKHGDEFTLKGQKAVYFKNLYTTGTNPVLTIVSES